MVSYLKETEPGQKSVACESSCYLGKDGNIGKEVLGMGTYFARSSLFTQTSGIIHRGKMCSKQPIKTLLKRQNKYRKIKSTLAISKAQSQVNNFTNLVHAPSVHVH